MNIDDAKMDKTVFSIASLSDGDDKRKFWLSKTPQERLEAMELMRQILYGYDPSTARIQKVFEVTRRLGS